jgi:hypothetical protein
MLVVIGLGPKTQVAWSIKRESKGKSGSGFELERVDRHTGSSWIDGLLFGQLLVFHWGMRQRDWCR